MNPEPLAWDFFMLYILNVPFFVCCRTLRKIYLLNGGKNITEFLRMEQIINLKNLVSISKYMTPFDTI